MKIDSISISHWMNLALEQASLGAQSGEVPVGAVIFSNNQLISSAHNQVETLKDATAHAEVLAIKRAGAALNNWRLNDVGICVTLEPCPMCIGAIRLARIPTIIFGARDPKMGALGSLFNIGDDPRLGAIPRIIENVRESESLELLRKFFEQRRA